MLGKDAVGRSREPGKTMFDGGIWTSVLAIILSLFFFFFFVSSFFFLFSFFLLFPVLFRFFLLLSISSFPFDLYFMTWLTTSQNYVIELLKCSGGGAMMRVTVE